MEVVRLVIFEKRQLKAAFHSLPIVLGKFTSADRILKSLF